MSRSAATENLRDYVAIPSVNPMGREDIDGAITGETRYAEHLKGQLGQLGVDAELLGAGERKSVVAHVQASGSDADTVVVASHLDTVPVDGMTIDPFAPRIEGERLYGRGSCDTKGGMAALVAALSRVLERGKLRRNLILVGESDEEAGSLGIQDVIAHLAGRRPDWAIATEPTGMRLVTHHKGCVTARIDARGRSVHGSDPDAGDNAIETMALAVLAVRQENERLRAHPDPRLGAATISVGLAGGGKGVNVVPDQAWLSADRRTIPGEDEGSVRAQLERALVEAGLAERTELTECYCNKDPLSTPDDDPGVMRVRQALRDVGLDDSPTGVAFGTDAGPLSLAGIPSVVLGPGDIAQAHTKDEWIELRQLEEMTEFFVRLLG